MTLMKHQNNLCASPCIIRIQKVSKTFFLRHFYFIFFFTGSYLVVSHDRLNFVPNSHELKRKKDNNNNTTCGEEQNEFEW